jgi:hypothetical protein
MLKAIKRRLWLKEYSSILAFVYREHGEWCIAARSLESAFLLVALPELALKWTPTTEFVGATWKQHPIAANVTSTLTYISPSRL